MLALNTPVLLLATTANSAPAWNASRALTYSIGFLVLGLLLGIVAVLLFLYLTGRLVGKSVEKGIGTTGDVSQSAIETTGKVVTATVETVGDVAEKVTEAVSEGVSAFGHAISEFVKTRDSEVLYAAIAEMKPTLEMTTFKMRSIVYHKLERKKALRGRSVLIQVMPVQASYGYDLNGLNAEDIRFDAEANRLTIVLPPLRVLALEKGDAKEIFSTFAVFGGEPSHELLRESQRSLDERMRQFARSAESLSMAEELSRSSFMQLIEMMFIAVPEEARPRQIELLARPREEYSIELPKPLQLEAHHEPDDDFSSQVDVEVDDEPVEFDEVDGEIDER
ncbi:DUF4230 domain-containing protein [bacterium]|nr:DUF4230 domain-containing protein [bacterium]